jgi:hypothetical protein
MQLHKAEGMNMHCACMRVCCVTETGTAQHRWPASDDVAIKRSQQPVGRMGYRRSVWQQQDAGLYSMLVLRYVASCGNVPEHRRAARPCALLQMHLPRPTPSNQHHR